jgi:type I restriction enzyme S subunit
VNTIDLRLCFVTWSDETSDREDCEFYQPEYIALERALAKQKALSLEDVADFAQRVWSPSLSDQPFRYIDIASVNIRTGDVQAIEMPEAEAPSRARKRVEVGDIIVSTVRPERNAVAFIREDLAGSICSTGFAVLTPRAGIDPYALYAFLKSPYFIAQAVRRSTASMYPAVAEEALKDVLVPRRIIEQAEELSRAVRAAFQVQERFLTRLRDVSAHVERLVNDPG